MTTDTIATLYRRACRWRRDATFFADPGERVTGFEAIERTTSIAAALSRQGVGPGDRVAFLCESSVRHALAWFAVILRGAVACNLHVRETPDRLAEALRWLDAKLVLCDARHAPRTHDTIAGARGALRAIVLDGPDWDALCAVRPVDATAPDPAPHDLAAILLSSGSTGRPKGVMHTQRTLLENAKAGPNAYGGLTPDDATLVMMQPSFAAWPNIVLPFVAAHARVVFGGPFSPGPFLATLERERITMAPLVPTLWRMALAEDRARLDLSALRVATISGEPPSRRDIEQLGALCPQLVSIYLSSEGGCGCGVFATRSDLLVRGKAASSGKPVPHADLRIVDPDGPIDRELPLGAIGEVALSGPSLAVGYWKDEAHTRERFVRGWWRSGDLGRIDAEGDLSLEGRTDNVINSGGIKVHAEEVERALLGHSEVAQAAVIGVADDRFGERIEAFVVARSAALTAAALDAFCRTTAGLAPFKCPKAIHFVERLPTGPTGKLYRRALKAHGGPR